MAQQCARGADDRLAASLLRWIQTSTAITYIVGGRPDDAFQREFPGRVRRDDDLQPRGCTQDARDEREGEGESAAAVGEDMEDGGRGVDV